MLSRGKFLSRYGVLALTIPMALCMTGTASAAVLQAGQSNMPIPAYDNEVQAGSQTNGYTDYNVKYQFEQTNSADVNATNNVDASATYCHDCGAIAVGFQVVAISKQNLSTIVAHNSSEAVSYSCTRCNVLAGAYQIIVATNTPENLSLPQTLGLASIEQKLGTIQRDGLTASRAQQVADGLADEAVAILRGGSNGSNRNSPYSPAANNSADLPGHMTQTNGPVVDLFENCKY